MTAEHEGRYLHNPISFRTTEKHMAWEKRKNGSKYFYDSRQVNGRTVKVYFGRGPLAQLAAQKLEARKAARKDQKRRLAATQHELAPGEAAIHRLEQAELKGSHAMSQPLSTDATTPDRLPTDVQKRIQELLAAKQAGDPSADHELASLVERFPALWMEFCDLGHQALEIWVNLIAGKDQMVRAALRQKLADIRRRFDVSRGDPAGKLIVDRVIATWLQVSHADACAAQNSQLDLRTQEFLARRQQQAQKQHLAAINAWRQWQRLAADLPRPASPAPPGTGCTATDSAVGNDPWIVPFSKGAATA